MTLGLASWPGENARRAAQGILRGHGYYCEQLAMNGPVPTQEVYARLVHSAIDRLPAALLVVDAQRRICHANQAAAALLGRPPAILGGMELRAALMPLGAEVADALAEQLAAVLRRGLPSDTSCESVIETRLARPAALEVSLAAVNTQGPPPAQGAMLVLRDITEQWSRTNELHYQATHDSLTGLINRFEFEQRLDEFMRHHRRTGVKHALCYIDLDHFKSVNDRFGHGAGDRLLSELSDYLHARIRKGDVLGRLGGDEFGLILGSCSGAEAAKVAQSIQQEMTGFRFVHANESFRVAASFGVTDICEGAASIEKILEAADCACYAAKKAGRSGCVPAVVHTNQWSERGCFGPRELDAQLG